MTKRVYTIEKHINRVGPTPYAGRSPFEEMEIGDSIRYETGYAARAAGKAANKRYAPKKFDSGVDGDAIPRVWRVA